MKTFRFTKTRQVHNPTRGNPGDAGIDFYVPENLTVEQMSAKNTVAAKMNLN